uniref:Uncharacterized protein n=1 Tax=Panagrolaimus sp. PS1159 TaxID=55785 RepID=A0AC35FDT9_9BILA
MFMEEEEKGFAKPQKAINPLEFPGKPPIIANLKEGNPETISTKPKQRKEIDSLFDLDEDPEKPVEKYGEDIDISDDDRNDDDDENETEKEIYNSSKDVPHSLPMNINFGVDPLNRRRGPIEKEPKSVKASIPTGSIYENMQVLSRSIQSADYRNRVWGTKPKEASDAVGYSQSYQTHGYTRPRTIFCQQPAQRVNISEETLEETSTSLETPK